MNYFKHQGPLLLVNGYRIVKIAGRGKNPIENGWTRKIVTAEDCENDNAADRSVGIICGEDVMCVDVDIYEHELADEIMAVIKGLVTAEDCENDNAADRSVGIICGEDVMCVDVDIYEHELADEIMAVIKGLHPDSIIPTRYGARPKFAMLFRNVDNLAPTRSPLYAKGEGDEKVTAQIEFRGKNQQFVAFGIHPGTGKEYEWENGSPEFLPVDDLPPLTKVTAQIEFRGKNQQFVAFGIHPGTGKEYEWENGSPEFLPVDDLPPLTKDDFEKIMREIDTIARSLGYTPPHPLNSALAKVNEKLTPEDLWLLNHNEKLGKTIAQYERDLFDSDLNPPHPLNSALAKVNEKLTPEDLWLLNHNEKLGKTIAQYERDLFDSDLNPADYKDWITAGQAGHFEFDADPMAMEVWDRWSQQAPNYKDREEIERKWRSFRSDKTNLVTYRTLLKHIPDGMERSGYVINEKTLAIAISEHLRGTLKFIPDANRWMIYENGHWVDQHKAFADKRIAYAMDYILNLKRVEYAGNTTLKKIVDGLIKKYDTNLPSLLEKVRGYLMAISNMCVTSDIFDADRRYFGVGNGDIDLTTGELLKPDPQRYISRHTNICFVPEADCPRWKQTLRECLDDDEMVDYFQKVVGQAALGQTNKRLIVFLYGFGCNGKSTILEGMRATFGDYQRTASEDVFFGAGGGSTRSDFIVFLYGFGCNGKSTILEGMRATFGDYQRTASEDVFFGAGGGSTRSDLIDLRGARLIELPETERGGRFNATRMKRITGGDEISVRAPYAAKQERFSLVGIPFIATNYFPDIKEMDNGTWGRISLIEFPRNFDNDPDFVKDEHLGEKLALEYEGILNWVIEGALKVQKEGLQKPEKMKKAIDKHREENDVLGQFIEETLVFTGNEKDHVDGRVLNDRWSAYARDSRNKFGLNSRSKLMSEMVRRYRLTSVTVRGVPRLKGLNDRWSAYARDSRNKFGLNSRSKLMSEMVRRYRLTSVTVRGVPRLKGVKLREEVMDSGDED